MGSGVLNEVWPSATTQSLNSVLCRKLRLAETHALAQCQTNGWGALQPAIAEAVEG